MQDAEKAFNSGEADEDKNDLTENKVPRSALQQAEPKPLHDKASAQGGEAEPNITKRNTEGGSETAERNSNDAGPPVKSRRTTMSQRSQSDEKGGSEGAHAGPRPTAVRAVGSRVIVNSPGMRMHTFTVPLQTLQALQPNQGIHTGQPGHLLVKTATGHYQILRVAPTGTATAAPVAGGLPTQPVPLTGAEVFRLTTTTTVVWQAAPIPIATQQQASIGRTALPVASAGGVAAATTRGGAVAGRGAAAAVAAGGRAQMTPDVAKVKCKDFLAALWRLAVKQTPAVATNVRNLIQCLVDGTIEPEYFTNKLQKEVKSSPQPCLVPFLRKSLPLLQNALRTGELSIDGVRAPPAFSTPAMSSALAVMTSAASSATSSSPASSIPAFVSAEKSPPSVTAVSSAPQFSATPPMFSALAEMTPAGPPKEPLNTTTLEQLLDFIMTSEAPRNEPVTEYI